MDIDIGETYDIAKYEEYSEIVGKAQLFYSGMDIFWMKSMISKTKSEQCQYQIDRTEDSRPASSIKHL